MKRVLTALLVLTLLFSLTVYAAPAAEQTVEIRKDNDTVTVVATQPNTFWESPALKAGERITVAGNLTITNTTDVTREVFLRSVELPYGNKAALEYLNHLNIVVSDGEAVLYEGPYSRINDGENLTAFHAVLDPDESMIYTITLSCDYTYTGTADCADTLLEWRYTTPLDDTDPADDTDTADPILLQWLIAGIATVILTVILLLYSRKIKR